MKILLAADGSEFTRRAARYVAAHVKRLASPPEIHLLNVHAPLPYARAASVAGADAVNDYHEEDCLKALEVAEDVLREAGIPYTASWIAGDVGKAIADYAKDKGIDLIVMGSHGHGQLRTLAMGSVADAVLRASPVPVTIVK